MDDRLHGAVWTRSSITALAVMLSVFTLRARPVAACGDGAEQVLLYLANAGGTCDQERDAVRQAVVEYFATKYTDVLCLSLSDDDVSVASDAGDPGGPPRPAPRLKDPDEAFIAGLSDLSSRLKPGSACRLRYRRGQPLRVPMRDAVREKHTGRHAIKLFVGRVHCLEAGHATVSAHTYCGGLCASWRTCKMEYRDGRWKVSDCSLDAISWPANLPVKLTVAYGARSLPAGR